MPKKAVNLSVNADLLSQAKALGINLSQSFEGHLIALVREARRAAWLAENTEALDDYGRYIGENGTFSDGLRRF